MPSSSDGMCAGIHSDQEFRIQSFFKVQIHIRIQEQTHTQNFIQGKLNFIDQLTEYAAQERVEWLPGNAEVQLCNTVLKQNLRTLNGRTASFAQTKRK